MTCQAGVLLGPALLLARFEPVISRVTGRNAQAIVNSSNRDGKSDALIKGSENRGRFNRMREFQVTITPRGRVVEIVTA